MKRPSAAKMGRPLTLIWRCRPAKSRQVYSKFRNGSWPPPTALLSPPFFGPARPGGAPVARAFAVPLQHGHMLTPFLRLGLAVGRHVEAAFADPRRPIHAEVAQLLRDMGEHVVGPGLPKPLGGRLGVIAEALLGVPQGLFRPIALAVLPLQIGAQPGVLQPARRLEIVMNRFARQTRDL